MKIQKLSELLALLGWISFIVECWLLLTRQIPPDFLSWFFFGLFFLLALFASVQVARK